MSFPSDLFVAVLFTKLHDRMNTGAPMMPSPQPYYPAQGYYHQQQQQQYHIGFAPRDTSRDMQRARELHSGRRSTSRNREEHHVAFAVQDNSRGFQQTLQLPTQAGGGYRSSSRDRDGQYHGEERSGRSKDTQKDLSRSIPFSRGREKHGTHHTQFHHVETQHNSHTKISKPHIPLHISLPTGKQFYGPKVISPDGQTHQAYYQLSRCTGRKKAVCVSRGLGNFLRVPRITFY